MPISRNGALVILALMPLFFSSNIIFGRAAVDEIGPFTLAFLRWSLTALALAILGHRAIRTTYAALRALTWRWFGMAFLGMWVCGALVYWALVHTSATNGTLIYTTAPVLIIAIEAMRGRTVSFREAVGIVVALLGVVVIVSRGSIEALMNLEFNGGDLVFVATAVSWAAYSVLLKDARIQAVPTIASFCALSAAGAVLLVPFALYEIATGRTDALSSTAWAQVAGVVVFASLLPFSAYQMGVRVVGPSLTGVFLYLLPVYGVGMAVLFLDESFRTFHAVGIATVLGGVVLATFPRSALSRGKAASSGKAP